MSAAETSLAQARIRELVGQFEATPAGRVLRSPEVRRRRACEVLLASDDPVLREIGEQVRDGRMRLADGVRVPAYAEAFANAAKQAAERLDPRRVADQLGELVARSEGAR